MSKKLTLRSYQEIIKNVFHTEGFPTHSSNEQVHFIIKEDLKNDLLNFSVKCGTASDKKIWRFTCSIEV